MEDGVLKTDPLNNEIAPIKTEELVIKTEVGDSSKTNHSAMPEVQPNIPFVTIIPKTEPLDEGENLAALIPRVDLPENSYPPPPFRTKDFATKKVQSISRGLRFRNVNVCPECNQVFRTNVILQDHIQEHCLQKAQKFSPSKEKTSPKTGPSFLKTSPTSSDDKSPEHPTHYPSKTSSSSKPRAKRKRLALREQLTQFKKERVYDCKFCMKMYHIRKPYEKHLREQHEKTDEEIRDLFKDEDNDIPAELVYRCPICSKVYLMAKPLETHIQIHGPDGSLIHKCPCYCKIHFRTKEEAMEHAKIEHKSAIYCEICDKYSQSPEAHNFHKRTHSERRKQTDRNFICVKCAKTFSNRTSLNDHTRSNCGQNPLYHCDVCDKRFHTTGNLKTHSLLHKDETPFVCDKCGKAFKIQSEYKKHLKQRHSDDKPFKCELCPKQYPYRQSLLTHMSIHTGLKRYSCDGCSKRFTCISNLQAHRRVYADTCGLHPLNSKPSHRHMSTQDGMLLMDAKLSSSESTNPQA